MFIGGNKKVNRKWQEEQGLKRRGDTDQDGQVAIANKIIKVVNPFYMCGFINCHLLLYRSLLAGPTTLIPDLYATRSVKLQH